MIVTPEAPVRAVKKAQAIRIARGRPPGASRKRDWETRVKRSGVLPWARMNPEKVNRGMAMSVGLLATRYSSINIAAEFISAL